MRTIPLNVNLDGAITPDNILAGYEGEHNVTKLDIYIASALTSSISFFRLALGDYLTDELYPENDKINYLLPGNVMFAPVLLIQLEGYKEKDGEIELVFKSDIVSAQIKPSLTAIHEIPKEMEQGLGGALAKLSYYVENSTELADAFSNMLEEAKEVLEQNSAEWDNKTAHATETMNALLNTGRAVLEETQNALASKANAATTLAGYNITDAYTKRETDLKLLDKPSANSVYTRSEIDAALPSGMCEEYKSTSNVFKEYLIYDDSTLLKTHYLYIEHPSVMLANAKYKLRLNMFFDFSEIRNFCVCVGDIHHPVIENIPLTLDVENYEFTESTEFALPDTITDQDTIIFRFDCVGNAPQRPAPYSLFALRLLPCYDKEQVDGLLESKADSSDVPTKVSELTNDSGYLVESDIVSKADSEDIPKKVSELENDSGYLVASDIENKANISDIPTKVSQLSNDKGYLGAKDITNKADKATTLLGYGITDAYTKTELREVLPTELQETAKILVDRDAALIKTEYYTNLGDDGEYNYSYMSIPYDDIAAEWTNFFGGGTYRVTLKTRFEENPTQMLIYMGQPYDYTDTPFQSAYTYDVIEKDDCLVCDFKLPSDFQHYDTVLYFMFPTRSDEFIYLKTIPYKLEKITTKTSLSNINAILNTKADKPSWRIIEDGETVTLADNTNYYVEGAISNLTINYPVEGFICSLELPLASSGDITITLPQSKYIGGTPTFANGETWELNIKNGVVVGGLVE